MNQTLSKRALAVRNAPPDLALCPSRIETRGYGEVAANDSAGGRQFNRPVAIVPAGDGQRVDPRR